MPEPLARDKLYSLKYFNLLAKAPPAKCRDVPGKKGGWQTAKGALKWWLLRVFGFPG